jgi:hypothetical protein
VKTLHHNPGDPFHEFIAQLVVGFTLLSQRGRIQEKGFGRLEGTGIEVPKVWRKQPRPTEDFAWSNNLNQSVPVISNIGFQSDSALMDEIKTVRGISFPKD